MDNKTEGAWIIHHTNKLKEVDGHDFDDIEFAGKSGKLLSGLAASHESRKLSSDKVLAIAKFAGVNKVELPTLLDKLKADHLIDKSSGGDVEVLGVVTSSILTHTANIFNGLVPSSTQRAAILLSESITNTPTNESSANEYISDTYKITKKIAGEIIQQSEDIGFVDAETIDGKKVLFNGNLFKSGDLKKAQTIIDSLSSLEATALRNIDSEIKVSGCIPFEKAERIAGRILLEKLACIGMLEFNEVSNPKETRIFVTKPSSFAKYGNPFTEDALDLAKALVASLSYGIIYSSSGRGRIDQLESLLLALINGRSIGPATAIGQDYKYLEGKSVVQILPDRWAFSMRLLKKEVGELALQVMQKGGVTESSLLHNSSDVVSYSGPEAVRRKTRKKRAIKQSDEEVAKLLRTIRSK